MSRSVKPTSLRLGITTTWPSRWFFKKPLRFFLAEDQLLRCLIMKQLPKASVASIEIERTREDIRVSIKTNKPGLIIGRRGSGIEELNRLVVRELKAFRKERHITMTFSLHLDVVEIPRTDIAANIVAAQIAQDLERRLPFRAVLKRHLQFVEVIKGIRGAKLTVSGRLNGAEIARTESVGFGEMPLQTLRANIDFGRAIAYTTYGTIGVDVWLYKGKEFTDKHHVAA